MNKVQIPDNFKQKHLANRASNGNKMKPYKIADAPDGDKLHHKE